MFRTARVIRRRIGLALAAAVAAPLLVVGSPATAATDPPRFTEKHYVLSTVGHPVNEQFEATGGTGALTYSLRTTLPPGLSLSQSGLVTGIPTRAGVWEIIMEATDSAGESDFSGFVWRVARPLTYVGLRSLISFAGREESEQLEFVNPDNVVVTYSATGLPAGLHLDETTGLVTGRPTVAGVSHPVVTLHGPDGHTDTATLTWTVHATPVIRNPGDQTTVAGAAVHLPLEVEHNGNPLSFYAFSLPYGLDIDEDTGVISGTTRWSQEPSTVTVTVWDTRTGARSETSFSWRVDEAPQA